MIYLIEDKKIRFIPYSRLYKMIKDEGEEYERDFLNELKQWIEEYSQWRNIENVEQPWISQVLLEFFFDA